LLLVFHGGGGNPGQVLKSSDIRERAEREGWILVAPAGSGRMGNLLTWNVGFGFGYALTAKVDDVGFVRRLLDELQATYRIDPDRIYATGISNGGILCHQLVGALSDRIAAIAPIVASAGGRLQGAADWIRPPSPRHPVAVVAFNGALDLSIPLSGGLQQRSWAEPVEVWSARESVDFWVRANGCRPEPEVERNIAARFERWRFTGGRGGSEVVQYVLLDQGHAWPGGERGYRRGDEPARLVSANALMIEFFRQHPKKR
jgi:polyhydroxybutyrate depolymerase